MHPHELASTVILEVVHFKLHKTNHQRTIITPTANYSTGAHPQRKSSARVKNSNDNSNINSEQQCLWWCCHHGTDTVGLPGFSDECSTSSGRLPTFGASRSA